MKLRGAELDREYLASTADQTGLAELLRRCLAEAGLD